MHFYNKNLFQRISIKKFIAVYFYNKTVFMHFYSKNHFLFIFVVKILYQSKYSYFQDKAVNYIRVIFVEL